MHALELLAAVAGALVVLATTESVIRTLVVPRGLPSWLAAAMGRCVDVAFRQVAGRLSTYESRDGVLTFQAPVALLMNLLAWLVLYLFGFSLLLWPATRSGYASALRQAGSSMFTLGFAAPVGAEPTVVDLIAAAAGLVVVALQIGYLPTIYSAFNRRETEVTLLVARAGVPAWGPELLARTRYGMRVDDLPELYRTWERWAADVAESHASYPVLIRFRSPRALSSWLISLLAVMDSAAVYLAVNPSQAPVEARLLLRMGFTCLQDVAQAVGIDVDRDPRPDAPIAVTFAEFEVAVQRLRDVGFPVERAAEEAWPDFRGWRVNYEHAAYTLAYRIDAVPALWSGPRRHSTEVIEPHRPQNRTPAAPDRHSRPLGRAPGADR